MVILGMIYHWVYHGLHTFHRVILTRQVQALRAIPDKICNRRSNAAGEHELLGKEGWQADV